MSTRRPKLLTPHERFERNIPLAGRVCNLFCKHYRVPVDEFWPSALEGLWFACVHNDWRKGFRFSTYAWPTIRGYLLHHLTKRWLPPKWLRTNRCDHEMEGIRAKSEPDGVDADAAAFLVQGFRERIPERCWLVLVLRWGLEGYEPHTLEETGRALGVTKERIRQIEARGMRLLRDSWINREEYRRHFPELEDRGSPKWRNAGPWDDENPWQQIALRAWEDEPGGD